MRFFIDCSYIDFSRQPTGIPRVVLQYIECGYRWAETSGIEVIPVVTTPSGLFPVRPLPGNGKPDYLKKFDDKLIEAGSASSLLEMSAHYLQSALVEANALPIAKQTSEAIRNLYRQFVEDSNLQPLHIDKGDVLFCPAYWHDVDPNAFASVQRRGGKVVTLVHDILPVTFPNFYQSPWKHEFEANLIAAMRNSDALFAVSQYTATSIQELADRKGIGDVKVSVAYNGHSTLISSGTQDKIDRGLFTPVLRKADRYEMIRNLQPFLMVGSIEPKKGHIPAIRALEALWDAGMSRPLVIIGRKGWLEESVVHAIRNSRYYDKRLFWFEDCDDLDLYFAYRYSRGLIFASYAEGFGIPMIEALASGCPVIGYDTPINREVLSSNGLMFDNFELFAKHILQLDDDVGFEAARNQIADFHWPSWQDVTTELFDNLVVHFAV
jgi:glycosyltransferase involved in cell wall biosynthesis